MGSYRALLVANSRFYEDPDRLPELNAPIYDMARLQDALIDPTLGVFTREHVQLLPNARCADALLSIEGFLLDCEPEDTMLLYYSGHGKLDINNNFFLCAADTRLDRLVSTAIRDEQVNAMMRKSPARSFVLVLDCCSSGGWKSSNELLPDPLKGTGRFLITSSRAGQSSSDAGVATESSPFTRYLVEAMAEADVDVDADGFVDIDEIYRYVERNLRETGQLAQRDFDKSGGSVALARRPKKVEPVPVPVPEHTAPIGPLEPPSLSVVPERIELTGIRTDDLPVVERIYVFNRGGGVLDWEADSDDAWITLEPLDDFVRVSLTPASPGSSRGTVYIRERDGAVERVPVQVQLEEEHRRRRQPVWPRLRTAIVGSAWTRAIVAAVALVVVIALVIAAIDEPTPPDTGGGTPPTEMVYTWQAEGIQGGDPTPQVVYGITNDATREHLVAVGARGSKAATWVFFDGRWQEVPSVGSASGDQVISGITPFSGRFVAVGSSEGPDGLDAAAWWVSVDGALDPISDPAAFELEGDQVINKALSLKDEGVFAVGQNDGDGAVWFSSDGDDWTLEPLGELGGAGEQALLRVVQFTPSGGGTRMLIAVGYEIDGSDEDGAVWIAEEPDSWERVRVPDDIFGGEGRDRIIDVARDPSGGVVAVGFAESDAGDLDAAVWSSEDGRTWNREPSDLLGGPGDQSINRLVVRQAPSRPVFVAAGFDDSSGEKDAALWYSEDGSELQKETSEGTPLGGAGNQEIFALIMRPSGILAVGFDSRSEEQLAAIWHGE